MWKSPALSNNSKDIQVTTHVGGYKSYVINVGGGRESIDANTPRGCVPGCYAECVVPLPSCASVPRCLPVSQHVMMVLW